jgi:hypothetical protein
VGSVTAAPVGRAGLMLRKGGVWGGQTRITKYLELKAQGRSINAELRKSKGYRNPDFLRKIVEHFNIDEKRSHFAKDVFDPTAFPPEDYYDKMSACPHTGKEWVDACVGRVAGR